jgi:hypothetical protein
MYVRAAPARSAAVGTRNPARPEHLGELLGSERRVGGEVELTPQRAVERRPRIRVAHVARMHRLEPQCAKVGDNPDEAATQDGVRQERAREQPPDLGRRLRLEDQPGPHANNAQLRLLALETVEQPLDGCLVPRVERALDPVGRPRLVDEPTLRAGGIGADRRGVQERRHPGFHDRPTYTCRSRHVHGLGEPLVATRLDQPREVDHDRGSCKQRSQIGTGDVSDRERGLLEGAKRSPSRNADDLVDLGCGAQCFKHARADVSGGADDDDSHSPGVPRGTA